MRTIAIAALTCGALLLPGPATAGDGPVASIIEEIRQIEPEHAVIIIAGAVGGAVVLHAAFGGSAASWIGAGVGALVGDWYYVKELKGITVAGLGRTEAAYREVKADVQSGWTEVRAAIARHVE